MRRAQCTGRTDSSLRLIDTPLFVHPYTYVRYQPSSKVGQRHSAATWPRHNLWLEHPDSRALISSIDIDVFGARTNAAIDSCIQASILLKNVEDVSKR